MSQPIGARGLKRHLGEIISFGPFHGKLHFDDGSDRGFFIDELRAYPNDLGDRDKKVAGSILFDRKVRHYISDKDRVVIVYDSSRRVYKFDSSLR